jgi:hypothetical protein
MGRAEALAEMKAHIKSEKTNHPSFESLLGAAAPQLEQLTTRMQQSGLQGTPSFRNLIKFD